MIDPKAFYDRLNAAGIGFYAGVPDSLLKSFCAFVTDSVPRTHHVIAANEGGAVGIAMGYHMATGKVPLVYMQNSGLGNIVNPLLSLADAEVYRIPMLLLIGWRGEPGVKDEPQHVKQGRVMLAMLDAMEITHANIGSDLKSAETALAKATAHFCETGAPFALIVSKDAFGPYKKAVAEEDFELTREDAIEAIIGMVPENTAFVGTTGMASRELFEARARTQAGHHRDFLTVGGMGHASQIALGVALEDGNRPVVCLDGDGAAIMHMGGFAIIADQAPANFIHVVINNGAHGSVGGQPTVGRQIDLPAIAAASGYGTVMQINTRADLQVAFARLPKGPVLIEVNVRQGHRADLGRPTSTPQQNKADFMAFLGAGKAAQ